MRSIFVALTILVWVQHAYGFLVTAGYPAVCAKADFVFVLHVEALTGRGTWDATVLQQIYGVIEESRISLFEPHLEPESEPDEEIVELSDTGAMHLVPGSTYLAFLKKSDSGIAFVPATVGIDSYFVIKDGRVENLRRDERTGSMISMLLGEAIDDIRIQIPEQKARDRTLDSKRADALLRRSRGGSSEEEDADHSGTKANRAAEPGATDNPDGPQRLRKDH